MLNEVYSAIIALCGVSIGCLIIFTCIFSSYFSLKIYALYHRIFDKKNNRGKNNAR